MRRATAALRDAGAAPRVVVLTTYADDESIIGALSAGAVGYLTKDAARDDIRRALEAAAAGQSVLDPAAQASLLRAAEAAPGRPGTLPDGLTERAAEVHRPASASVTIAAESGSLEVRRAGLAVHELLGINVARERSSGGGSCDSS